MKKDTMVNKPRFRMNARVPAPLGLAIAAALNISFAASADAAGPSKWAEGRILVQPRAGLPDTELDLVLTKQGNVKSQGRLRGLDVHVVSVPAKAEAAVARALSRNPHIKFAEVDGLVGATATTPNDPKFANQWHWAKIQAPAAWDFSQGSGVTVAVLDSGVEPTHPDLQGKLLPGWNVVSKNTTTTDTRGHGTAVAGVIGAASNNGAGVASAAWNVSLLPVRITNSADGYAYYSDIAEGITWAADNGADIANISYEVNQVSTITAAAQYMRSKGGLVVVSAGNSSSDPGYADNPYIVSVSATDENDAKASWSSYGSYIDVAAPGNWLWTTSPGGGYGQWYGTSFSAPVVSGLAALIMSANPSLSPAQVETILESSADDLAGTAFHPYFGNGRVNAAKAVTMALQSATNDTQAPTAGIFSPTQSSTVSGVVTVAVSATDNVEVTEVALYANDQLVGTDTGAPYQFSWDSRQSADGSVTLTAEAYDAKGNAGVSSDVTVQVKNTTTLTSSADTTPPTVTFGSPANNSTVGSKVSVVVNAKDNTAVSSIKLLIDGKQVATMTNGVRLSYTWNTRSASKGKHTLQAVAADPAGNIATTTLTVYK